MPGYGVYYHTLVATLMLSPLGAATPVKKKGREKPLVWAGGSAVL